MVQSGQCAALCRKAAGRCQEESVARWIWPGSRKPAPSLRVIRPLVSSVYPLHVLLSGGEWGGCCGNCPARLASIRINFLILHSAACWRLAGGGYHVRPRTHSNAQTPTQQGPLREVSSVAVSKCVLLTLCICWVFIGFTFWPATSLIMKTTTSTAFLWIMALPVRGLTGCDGNRLNVWCLFATPVGLWWRAFWMELNAPLVSCHMQGRDIVSVKGGPLIGHRQTDRRTRVFLAHAGEQVMGPVGSSCSCWITTRNQPESR